jgi:pimeloyl-ACP methyl ester carboxylesterase
MTDRLLPPGATASWLPLGAGRVRVLQGRPPADGGSDRLPLLLVHGGGYDNAAISWSRVFAPLARDRPVIAPDLPGFGDTEGIPVTGDPDELADLVTEVVRSAGFDRFVVAGISMGGDIALRVALRHPDAVAGLVLVAPGGLTARLQNAPTQLAAWLAGQLPDRVLFGLGRLAGRFTDSYLSRMVHDPTTVDRTIRTAFAREARRAGSGIGYGRYNQATLGPRRMRNNLLPAVPAITAPTLLLHGVDDPLVDPRGSRAAAATMPSARLVLVPDCGHWLPVEKPDVFLTEIAAFLAALP